MLFRSIMGTFGLVNVQSIANYVCDLPPLTCALSVVALIDQFHWMEAAELLL